MVEQVQAVVVRTGGTPVRDVDYTSDALNRLLSETVVGATATTYSYDDVGNRLAKEACSGTPLVCQTTTYEYNANNELVSETGPDGTTSYFYDSNGSLIEKSCGWALEILVPSPNASGRESKVPARLSWNRMNGVCAERGARRAVEWSARFQAIVSRCAGVRQRENRSARRRGEFRREEGGEKFSASADHDESGFGIGRVSCGRKVPGGKSTS